MTQNIEHGRPWGEFLPEMPQLMGASIEEGIGGKESIIAIVGPIAAGKGVAADLLIQQGYVPFNYGDVIFEERTRQGLKEERKISNAVGANLRLRFGNDIIARRIAESIQQFRDQRQGKKILIDGLRHPAEVAWVKENLGARVIGITAPPEVRYQRTLRRNREVDPKSPEGFNEVDQEDRGVDPNKHGNQTDASLQLADVIIENNGEDLEEYKRKFYEALESLSLK